MNRVEEITLDTTVNEAVQRVPALLTFFARYGIDSCCGGALPIREAAKRHGLHPETLLDRLHHAALV